MHERITKLLLLLLAFNICSPLFSDLLAPYDFLNNSALCLANNPARAAHRNSTELILGRNIYTGYYENQTSFRSPIGTHRYNPIQTPGLSNDKNLDISFLGFFDLWYNISYQYNNLILASKETLEEDPLYKGKNLSNWANEVTTIGISKLYTSDLFLGLSLSKHQQISTGSTKYNDYTKTNYPSELEFSYYDITDLYYSLTVGLIKNIDQNKLLFSHKIYLNNYGRYNFMQFTPGQGVGIVVENNIWSQSITSVGYVWQLNQKNNFAFTLDYSWPLAYKSAQRGYSFESTVSLKVARLYTVAYEYIYDNTTNFQLFIKEKKYFSGPMINDDYGLNISKLFFQDINFTLAYNRTRLYSDPLSESSVVEDQKIIAALAYNFSSLQTQQENTTQNQEFEQIIQKEISTGVSENMTTPSLDEKITSGNAQPTENPTSANII